MSREKRVHTVKNHPDPFEELSRDEGDSENENRDGEEALDEENSEPESLNDDAEEDLFEEEPVDEAEAGSVEEKPEEDEAWNQSEEEDIPESGEELESLLVEHGTHELGIDPVDDSNSLSGGELHEGESSRSVSKDKIREQVLLKAKAFGRQDQNVIKLDLLELEKEKVAFIGRKKSVLQRNGLAGGLYVGRVKDDEKFGDYKLYLDSLNPHVVFVCGSRGSGKCLTGDTLITLEDGKVIPICDLEKTTGNVLGLNHELKMSGLSRDGFYCRKVDKLLKITLHSGKEIKITPEHPLLTVDGWKPAESLEKGSRVATPRIIPAFGKKPIRDCEAKILGYLIAEGHLSNHFVLFSNSDPVILEEFNSCIREFHPNLRVEEHSKPGCYRVAQKKKVIDISNIVRNDSGQFTNKGFIRSQKSSIMEWLIAIGIYGKLSVKKEIPELVMNFPKEQLSLFLNRLFSCDGSIYRTVRKKNSWCVDYSSSSGTLIRQVQHLLLRFGILSKLRKKKVKCNEKIFDVFELVIYGENVLKFISQIGFFGKKEKKAEIAEVEMLGLKRNPNRDTIPKEVWGQLAVSNWTEMGRRLGYSSPKSFKSSVEYSPSREKLLHIAQIQENKGIQMLAQSDIFWDAIEFVEELSGEFDVYDIGVPVYHNFVANDVIVHNSYCLGVMAEELALHNSDVGVVVVDPVGVFWSMKYPNKDEKELKALGDFDLMPQGLDNLHVFIPEGSKSDTPSSTFDGLFSVPPSLLTSEDWCLTFGMERFSPTGLLLEKALKKIVRGYRTKDGEKILGKKKFSLSDVVSCLESDDEIASKERGYRPDSIRALVSRFEAAKGWGIFSENGTPLSDLSKAGRLTVIDTSFLDDSVTALVIGILARRILSARKILTRQEAAKKFKSDTTVDSLLENEIPPTWLFIDEAHTLIPGGNVKTPATNAIVEYVKQGRRPGCSLVFATQQPSAIDSRVLSQLDIIMSHKLIFDDDIKAVAKRTPAIVPLKYKHPNFLKTLPVGNALTGDRREETSRAFVLGIRPRMSQHEGRDAETNTLNRQLSDDDVASLSVEMLLGKIEKEGQLDKETVDRVVQTLNQKYKSHSPMSLVLDKLEEKGVKIDPKTMVLRWPPFFDSLNKSQNVSEDDGSSLNDLVKPNKDDSPTDLLSFPITLSKKDVVEKLSQVVRKNLFGLGKTVEQLKEIKLHYHPLWKVDYRQFTGKTAFIPRQCYIDAEKGEFLHFVDQKFCLSSGLKELSGMGENDYRVLRALSQKSNSPSDLIRKTGLDRHDLEKSVSRLMSKNFILVDEKSKQPVIRLAKNIDLPFAGNEKLLNSLTFMRLVNVSDIQSDSPVISAEEIHTLLPTMWPNVSVDRVTEVFQPVFEATLVNDKTKEHRLVKLDGFTGVFLED